MTIAETRLRKELSLVRSSGVKLIDNIRIDNDNVFQWKVLILPDHPPYDKGAFEIGMFFSPDYPFKPPKVNLITKIYHPNIDEAGQVFLATIWPENWNVRTTALDVLLAVVNIIHFPDLEHPLRFDLRNEFVERNSEFMKKAEEFTIQHSVKRPSSECT